MNIRLVVTVKLLLAAVILFCNSPLAAQTKWVNVNAAYAPLPQGFNVFKTTDSLNGRSFIAYYAIANLKNKQINFTTDTSYKRRLTPAEFYKKNGQPLLVVNTTFFSFATNQNLNIIIKDGKLVSYNIHTMPGKGKDTLTYRHSFTGAIGITKKRRADVAWTYSDSSKKYVYASQEVAETVKDSTSSFSYNAAMKSASPTPAFKKWKMQSAVGGGPVLVQNGEVKITNNQELKFAGKAISDQHPRTLMGYTKDNQLIIMVIEGRNPGVAMGASLQQAAQLMAELDCVEALNLDGGGSSCMLINGKETIRPSDKVERAVPGVFVIEAK